MLAGKSHLRRLIRGNGSALRLCLEQQVFQPRTYELDAVVTIPDLLHVLLPSFRFFADFYGRFR